MAKPGYESRSGPNHPRWTEARMITPHGYVKIRVGGNHPLADPNGYVYEHLIVWVSAGNPRPSKGWLIHHRNEVKSDNRLGNLELKKKTRHGVDHASPLTDEQVRSIRLAYDNREANTTMMAATYEVPPQTIWKLITGKTRVEAGGPIQTGPLRNRKDRLLHGGAHNDRPQGVFHG